jgi:hypothetical protein
MGMDDASGVVLNFKIGVLKELYQRDLISRSQLDKAIKIIILKAREEAKP